MEDEPDTNPFVPANVTAETNVTATTPVINDPNNHPPPDDFEEIGIFSKMIRSLSNLRYRNIQMKSANIDDAQEPFINSPAMQTDINHKEPLEEILPTEQNPQNEFNVT